MEKKLKTQLIKLPKQKRQMYCGPIILSSIFNYFGKNIDILEISEFFGGDVSKGSAPAALAYASIKIGLKVDYVSSEHNILENNPAFSEKLKQFFKYLQIEKIQKNYLDLMKNETAFNFIKKEPSLEDIENYIDRGKPVIVGLDLNELRYKEKIDFPTHYVGVVGYDENNIIIHTTWPDNLEYEKINKEIFKKAWESNGWTKDIIIPYPK